MECEIFSLYKSVLDQEMAGLAKPINPLTSQSVVLIFEGTSIIYFSKKSCSGYYEKLKEGMIVLILVDFSKDYGPQAERVKLLKKSYSVFSK